MCVKTLCREPFLHPNTELVNVILGARRRKRTIPMLIFNIILVVQIMVNNYGMLKHPSPMLVLFRLKIGNKPIG